MKRISLAILIVIFGLGVVAFIRLSSDSTLSQSQPSDDEGLFESIFEDDSEEVDDNGDVNANTNAVNQNIADGLVSLSVLSQHSSKGDCWVGYSGKVYDVTSFLPNHPGSAATIIPYCGTYDEFTKAFTKQHGTSKVKNLMRVGTLIGDFEVQGRI